MRRDSNENVLADGRAYSDGKNIDWSWEPELTTEGDEVALSDLDEHALWRIAEQILDNEAHWGMIEA